MNIGMKYFMYKLDSFYKMRKSYEENSPIQEQMGERLLKLLRLYFKKAQFDHILEFGCGGGRFSESIREKLVFKSLLCTDINDFSEYFKPGDFLLLDMNEANELNIYFDLLIANAAFQWLEPKNAFLNLKTFLKKGGVLALSSFGENNIKEIKALSKNGLFYPDIAMLKALLKHAGFKLIKIIESEEKLYFKSPLKLLKQLKLSGSNALNSSFFIGKKELMRIEKEFKNTLTYHPIYILARA